MVKILIKNLVYILNHYFVFFFLIRGAEAQEVNKEKLEVQEEM